MTPKQLQLDTSKPVLHYRTERDGQQLAHGVYCSAHQTSICGFRTLVDLSPIAASARLPEFIANSLVMAGDYSGGRKRVVVATRRLHVNVNLSKFMQQTHYGSKVQRHSSYFCLSAHRSPPLQKKKTFFFFLFFLQADISLKRYCP